MKNDVLDILKQTTEYENLFTAAREGKTCAVFGPDETQIYYAEKLAEDLGKRFFLIVPSDEEAQKAYTFLRSYTKNAFLFPAKDYQFRQIQGVSRYDDNARIETISHIRQGDYHSVIIPAKALLTFVMPPEEFEEIRLRRGDTPGMELPDLREKLIGMGYEFFSKVEGPGQFSIRGDIFDIFPPGEELPLRIEFFGDEVDTISLFDIETQRRTEQKDTVTILPAKEFTVRLAGRLIEKLKKKAENSYVKEDLELLRQGILPKHDRYASVYYGRETGILDFVTENDVIFLFGYKEIKKVLLQFENQVKEDIHRLKDEGLPFLGKKFTLKYPEILEKIKKPIIFEGLPCSIPDFAVESLTDIKIAHTEPGGSPAAIEEIRSLLKNGYQISLSVPDSSSEARLKEVFGIQPNLFYTQDIFPFGFLLHNQKKALFIYKNKGERRRRHKNRFEKGEKIKSFADIKKGDFVGHSDFGIGIYDGIHKIENRGIAKDFIKILFAGTDVLYIPCDQLNTISKYIGGDTEIKVKLNKLGGSDWSKTKQKVRSAVRDLADQLILLYGQRLKLKGHAFPPDTEWQHDFEAGFEFEETEDQLKCIREIKKDMESPIPMERLLCGDVGFGKTEVALRAAFKCVSDSRQVAILAPTTILAFQHYQTAIKRFRGFPVTIEMLSRFRSPQQQTEIFKNVKSGKIDIIIGTHKILQKNIAFKDLGLIIIDEEQRFGVAHKEFLKNLSKTADILSLSATPIPRTLNMSLSGIRDISMLEEAPHNRYPVTTYVAEYDEGTVIDAIRREVARGGQCFYLSNRVDTISRKAAMLFEKTGFQIGIAHGKMSKEELADVWDDMTLGKIDVLVCTTIIETGIDLPNCNTLIIEDADRLGLAQLHQIRGRVGRTNRKAYSYFLYGKGKVLSSDAYKRLMTIREFTEFGSGLKIAMRDLEIRGAGDILGAEQSGHLLTVGFDMYMQLLEEAVSEKRGKKAEKTDCKVDLKLNAYIPDNYIFDSESRIEMYKLISGIVSEEDYREVLDEMIDRFSEPPKPVCNLLEIAVIRGAACQCGVTEITEKEEKYLIFLTKEPQPEQIARAASAYKGRELFYSPGSKPCFSLATALGLKGLKEFLNNLQKSFDTDKK